MHSDPFGNLKDWGPVLDLVCQLADEDKLNECQYGLTRILRYRDNWRLREETLKRIGKIEAPDAALVRQVIEIISDENLYYEVRIIACETLEEFLATGSNMFDIILATKAHETVGYLLSSQQPPIFETALRKLDSVITRSVPFAVCAA